jgi:uncharacterized protein YhhL (DUF1145 family)
MNVYLYNQTEDTFPNLKSKLKLDKSLQITIAKAILIPIVIYFIIYNFVSPNSAGFAVFVLMGTIVGTVISIIVMNSTIKRIKSVNKVEWNRDKIVFFSNEKVLKEWQVKNIEIIEKSDDALYLKIKSFTGIDYMAIPLSEKTPKEFVELFK